MSKILWITDMDVVGSGYLNLSTPLCQGLAACGHEVKVVGAGYRGQEHDFLFSIIPCQNMQEARMMMINIWNMWRYDVLIVAFDIYIHDMFLKELQQFKPFKYIGIFPVEANPLCMSWAMILSQMDQPLVISKFGTSEAHQAGVLNAEHLQIGIDTDIWKPATVEEYKAIRESVLGITDDTFVVLTVADNQERKNIVAIMDAFKIFSQNKKAVYVLVTREHNLVGWRLRDYANEIGISNKLMLFERGMPFKALWSLYATADVFILASKAEGLGMPLLEAMAMKIPCIATNCTGMKELLSDDRGMLCNYNYMHRDSFGNGARYWIDPLEIVTYLERVDRDGFDTEPARKYVESRNWSDSVLHLDNVIKKLQEKK